jgi:hypothetical protein
LELRPTRCGRNRSAPPDFTTAREGDNTADQPRKPPLIGGKGIE